MLFIEALVALSQQLRGGPCTVLVRLIDRVAEVVLLYTLLINDSP